MAEPSNVSDLGLGGLPAWAQAIAYVILAVSLGVVTLAARFGIHIGKFNREAIAPEGGTSKNAQIAAVIVDPSALNKATAAVEGLNFALAEIIVHTKNRVENEGAQAGAIERLAVAVSALQGTNSRLADLIGQYVADQREEREEAEIEKRLRAEYQRGRDEAADALAKKRP